MHRLVAFGSALVLVAALAGSSVAAPPTYRANHVVGNFDLLDWDGSVVGHVVVNYGEPTYGQVVPGNLDVTWLPNVRFPYDEPPYGAKESHTVLGAGFFGPDGSGATGSMCDFGAPWNYVCHDFGFVIELDPFGDGRNLVGFGSSDWVSSPAEFYVVGPGAFHVTYVGPTGPEPPKVTPPSIH
jgi:hypothetical protein